MSFVAKVKYYLKTDSETRAKNKADFSQLKQRCVTAEKDVEKTRQKILVMNDGLMDVDKMRHACIMYNCYPPQGFFGRDFSNPKSVFIKEVDCMFFCGGDSLCSNEKCEFYAKHAEFIAAKKRYDAAVAARDAFWPQILREGKNK